MNKKNIIITTSIIIVIILVSSLFISFNRNKSPLYIMSFERHTQGERSYGYIIYDDGTIKKYDNNKPNIDLINRKITRKELTQLRELADNVKDEYKSTNAIFHDVGVSTNKIYNSKTKEWVILSKSGESCGKNTSEEAKKIEELMDKIYEKYIQDDKTYF